MCRQVQRFTLAPACRTLCAVDSIWSRLPRPILALAPMEDVTDTVFRRIVARCGRPDVFFTEFIHTDIVLARRRKRPGVTPRLRFTEEERPLIAQIWGTDPEQHFRAAISVVEMGFDGIDLNMGCPVRKIRAKGACSALILQPALAAELIAAVREGTRAATNGGGAGRSDARAPVPVSVKTRIGFDRVATEEWVGHLLAQGIDALTVHGRTAVQESDGRADWGEIARAARIARAMGVATAVLGNGDVGSRVQGDALARRCGLDGVMIARGVFDDPYLFARDGREGRFATVSGATKIDLLLEHLRLYRDTWGEMRNYEILKKYFKIYLTGFPGANELRDRLNATHDYEAAEEVVRAWRATGGEARAPGDTVGGALVG